MPEELVSALALILVIEGALYALFPESMRRLPTHRARSTLLLEPLARGDLRVGTLVMKIHIMKIDLVRHMLIVFHGIRFVGRFER